MNLGNNPTFRRTWAQRHPVLSECLGVLGATVLVALATWGLLWALAS